MLGNVGRSSVDTFAPGIALYSTVAPNAYARVSGTSMSVPLVAGAAAILKSQDPNSYRPGVIKGELIDRGVDTLRA